ncbi:J domain-containing protein [Piscirickettsia litoralis]|uniref:J domain-containing protein n=1 Tax=Piscirickettsia litoralis TaxID=1891921 RepID=A0ABX2ZWK7_9GAMM|nr:J domain-containing protein [Piscirickettsia litoralis]ODN41011.1 hypothetical protein BGC07_18440 [Piscirickettsia litoralis]
MDNFTIKQALKIFGLTSGIFSALEIKKTYKRLTMKYHPDREGGSKELMQALLQAWNILKGLSEVNASEIFAKDEQYNANYSKQYANDAIIEKLKEALAAFKDFDSLDLEVCGVWLYLHTDLRGEQHKATREEMKTAGWKWAKNKGCWVFNPESEKTKRSARRTGWNMDKIRATHGSSKYKGKNKQNRLSFAQA